MKIGLNMWAFNYNDPIKRSVSLAKEAGFDGIEMNLGATGWLTAQTSEQELIQIRNTVADQQIEIPSVCSSLYWKHSLTSNNEQERCKAIENLQLQIKTAHALGAHSILCIPGMVSASFPIEKTFHRLDVFHTELQNESVELHDAYERSKHAMNCVLQEAESLDVCIGLENVGNHFLDTPDTMNQYISSLHSKSFFAYLDIGNVMKNRYPNNLPEHWIQVLNDKIGMVHIKDFQKKIGRFEKIGCGDLNLRAAVLALKEINYNGWLIVEYMEPDCWRENNYLSDTVKYIKGAMEEMT